MKEESKENIFFFKSTPWLVWVIFLLLLAGAIAVRLIDVTDLPLDFNPTRQLHSFIMARGYFYQMDTPATRALPPHIRQFGISSGEAEPVIEPPMFEYLTAVIYAILGKENILVPRLLSILFWVIGALPLFLIAKRMMAPSAAMAATAIYLYLPFGVIASRAFQPDPLMVTAILWALYCQLRWHEQDNWKTTLAAGLTTGFAVLVKAPAVFFVGLPLAALVLSKGLKSALTNKRVYVLAVLSLLPAVLYNWLSATSGGNADSIFGGRFFPALYTRPTWYADWLAMIKHAVGNHFLIAGLLGALLVKNKSLRWFLLSMWLGYVLYGFVFAYHIYTHDYYQLPLIPLVALGVGVVISLLFQQVESMKPGQFTKVMILLLLIASVGLSVRTSRGLLVRSDYRHEAAYWRELGSKFDDDTRVIALTHDYGYRLGFWGFHRPSLWPSQGDLAANTLMGIDYPAFTEWFDAQTSGQDYFLVTLLNDFASQSALYEHLFAHYPYESGDGYYLFNLNNQLPSP
jgi:hypothetical protein